MDSGSTPMGMYIPVKNPMSVPNTVLAVEKAFMLLKKLVIKNTIALEESTDSRGLWKEGTFTFGLVADSRISPTTFKRLEKGRILPP